MKKLILFCIALLSAINVFATAQMSDKLIYNGTEYSLHTNPLEVYRKLYPDSIKIPERALISSALWRGYIATYELRNDTLFMTRVEIMVNDTTKMDDNLNIIYENIIEDLFGKKEVVVDWFSGLLVVPYGEIVEYVHQAYASIYENYILLEMDKGIRKKERMYDNKSYKEFKRKQYLEYRKTDEYFNIRKVLIDEGYSDDYIDFFLEEFIIEYSSKILAE